MLTRKTDWELRSTYTYVFSNGEKVTLRPGRDGVTEADIKCLHTADDAEVFNNLKNARRPYTKEERRRWHEWEEEHPGETQNGKWNLSLDSLTSSTTNMPTADRFAGGRAICTTMPYDEDEADVLLRLREIIDAATDREKEAYQLVGLEGYTYKDAAKVIGISDVRVRKHYLTLIERIKNDPQLKNFFR